MGIYPTIINYWSLKKMGWTLYFGLYENVFLRKEILSGEIGRRQIREQSGGPENESNWKPGFFAERLEFFKKVSWVDGIIKQSRWQIDLIEDLYVGKERHQGLFPSPGPMLPPTGASVWPSETNCTPRPQTMPTTGSAEPPWIASSGPLSERSLLDLKYFLRKGYDESKICSNPFSSFAIPVPPRT